MIRPRRKTSKASLAASLVLHGTVLLLLLGTTLLGKGCASKKPNQKLMFVEFTVAVPPAAPESEPEPPDTKPPEPQDSIPEPPPPPPDNIPEPAKKPDPPKTEAPKPPDPPKPKPPKVIKQNKRVERTTTPTPSVQKGPKLTAKEIEDLIKKGAKIGTHTSIPDDPESQKLGAYSNHVRDRLYAAWQQPEALKNLPGLMAIVQITIQQDGRVGNGKIVKSSGNSTMDESVLKAVRTVKALRALPAGIKGPVDLDVEFELAQ